MERYLSKHVPDEDTCFRVLRDHESALAFTRLVYQGTEAGLAIVRFSEAAGSLSS